MHVWWPSPHDCGLVVHGTDAAQLIVPPHPSGSDSPHVLIVHGSEIGRHAS